MLKSGLVACVAFVLVFLALPAYAGAGTEPGCCQCGIGDFTPCPTSAPVCFTGSDSCSAKCAALGCNSTRSDPGVCGEGDFQDCEVIDPPSVHRAPALSFPALALLLLTLVAISVWRLRRAR